MQRRQFLQHSLVTTAGLGWGLSACTPGEGADFRQLCTTLLNTWVYGMLAQQISVPTDPTRHGLLGCPVCDNLHGRCMDAAYPFLRVASTTGDERLIQAAIDVMSWAENNVSQPDGSWTVVPNPKSWKGISVFSAIALAEALHHHGALLPAAVRDQWHDRLISAANYVYNTFDLTFTNINYGYTALYGLSLFSEVLDAPKYAARAQVLAKDAGDFLTKPNHLLFGEAKPTSDRQSAKGLYGVDLGYNVEESLNGAVLYALREGDDALLQQLIPSLQSHLEFMLPDGGWDNSWGTRQFKWTYWGSRTSDGCQPAFAMLADRVPAFGTAAYRNTELLARCTAENGLLYGGLHYAEHDIGACIHHTFAHAKPLAFLLDQKDKLPKIRPTATLPRLTAQGSKYFPELDVSLLATGPWRATVSAYDHIYRKGVLHGTGGALTLLHHAKLGLLCAASMASYREVERFNQQPDPDGENFCLTPRLETHIDGSWYTNIHDLKAALNPLTSEDASTLTTTAQLTDQDHQPPAGRSTACDFTYRFTPSAVSIKAVYHGDPVPGLAFVLPIISPLGERVSRVSEREITITKAGGTLHLRASAPLEIIATKRERVFNMVPGVQALPVRIFFPTKTSAVNVELFVG